MPDRDPRVNPQLLDIVQVVESERCVEYVTALGTVIYSIKSGRHERRCSLDAWRRWAKGGKVVRVGRLCVTPTNTLVKLDEGNRREVNALRNRLGTIGGRMADEDEIATGLVSLALAVIEYHTPDPPRIGLEELEKAIVASRR